MSLSWETVFLVDVEAVMAEHTSLFDDNASSHPLDLLINAISGSGDYNLPDGRDVYRDGDVELDLDGLLGSTEAAHEPRVVRRITLVGLV